ncbi:GNAT family N-acetyltransferase [Paenibacillus thermotolerans]|uniref:GNAT family N-acetyltransferase n=1 Tax=Paenibacillus thermotolerans TaxID=3027807 RepID=UPI0023682ED6|nr:MULTISPECIES: GNAT family N-acetyltransferase [unclassified Paenibacillus]
MKVVPATPDDINEWLKLAAEVEYLFGSMVNDPNFIKALRRNIDRNTALCIRKNDGPSGSPLLGGLLWSSNAPVYKIVWLSVASQARKHGVASKLLHYVLRSVEAPAEVFVTTFGEEVADGQPARMFYKRFGFVPLDEKLPNGPEGGSRQKFKLIVSSSN